ncbi:pyruvate dehydrogenase (acetyl-transferring) E1 component subunit alpha [Homoserinimonas sp. OAct 916]|uniref:pyruvate dehydrogenase (acetyl-transferring) E1 component subunit alpha n=1 Tax=Homoserinimonas sp. OAct 916 TaxID=2211450 RepID=UPI000DBE62B1|nr:pyruvate dehydrogenase (acetyl-transferring) E1 component subunit alpha [Homoserinimonas sp. OAct 916]
MRPDVAIGELSERAMLPSEHPVCLIDENGRPQPDRRYALPSAEQLVAGYRGMVIGRRINDQCSALVRQGRLAVYPSSHGQEACQLASVLALGDEDWLFPTYRDTIAVMARGVDLLETMVLLRGTWHSGYDPTKYRVAPQATPLATQLLHAVGVAHAATLQGQKTVVLALCGDGATSEGDFHEALNFAAVFNAPVVFLVQNNQYAISVPLHRQTKAPSLAHKAIGYGMPGVRVDGNDFAALQAVVTEAISSARAGQGPTLVEAHTYRIEAHTNADDAARYRDQSEVTEWIPKDPLIRMKTYLTDAGLLDSDLQKLIEHEANEQAAVLRHGLNKDVELDPAVLFEHVYSVPTPQLREQAALLADELEREDAQ